MVCGKYRGDLLECGFWRLVHASTVDGVRGNVGGGGNRKSGRNPDHGNAERGVNRSSRRSTAVSREEMADRVARQQTD